MNEDNNGDYRCKKDDVLAVTNEISITEDKIITVAENNISNHHTSSPAERQSLLNPTMKFELTKYRHLITNRNIRVDILAILFGIGAWIGVNSIFIQLPVIVATAPEGWSLPSYIVIIVQIANIGPLLYTLIQKYSPRKMIDSYLIYCIFTIGCLSAILMAFFYHRTIFIGTQQRSAALFILAFGLAIVGCTSSVLFMPYMGRFRDIYLVTYLVGEGLSGFLPSVVALIQGVGGNPECTRNDNSTINQEFILYSSPPRFGSKAFFIFVFAIFIISFCAFILLNKLKMCKKEYAIGTVHHGNEYHYAHNENSNINNNNNNDNYNNKSIDETTNIENVKKITPFHYKMLLILMGIVCMFAHGIFPAIQSYSCLPYGNLAYHLTATLCAIANPLACLIAVFLNHTSMRCITILSILAGIFTTYAITTSVLSPMPPLVGTTGGEFLVVITWPILFGLISYIKLSITSIFRYQGGKSLVWVGVVTQTGSTIGAILIFCLINVLNNIFIAYDPCSHL